MTWCSSCSNPRPVKQNLVAFGFVLSECFLSGQYSVVWFLESSFCPLMGSIKSNCFPEALNGFFGKKYLLFSPPSWVSFVQLLNRSVKVTVWRVFGCLNVKLTCVRCSLWSLGAVEWSAASPGVIVCSPLAGRHSLVLRGALIHRSIQCWWAECTNLSGCRLVKALEGTLSLYFFFFCLAFS